MHRQQATVILFNCWMSTCADGGVTSQSQILWRRRHSTASTSGFATSAKFVAITILRQHGNTRTLLRDRCVCRFQSATSNFDE